MGSGVGEIKGKVSQGTDKWSDVGKQRRKDIYYNLRVQGSDLDVSEDDGVNITNRKAG